MNRLGDLGSVRRKSGQSAVEFLIVAPLVIVLIMGGLQFALLYRAKLTMNLATFEAARAASVENASWISMKYGFSRSMAALYALQAPPGSADGSYDAAVTSPQFQDLALRAEFLANSREGLPWWDLEAEDVDDDSTVPICIERVNPPEVAFATFGYSGSNPGEPLELPNDNLAFRSRVIPLGATPTSIQDLNLLQVRISYCHPMIVPVAGRLISSVMLLGDGRTTAAADRNNAEDLNQFLIQGGSAGGNAPTRSAFEAACLAGNLTGRGSDEPFSASYGFPMVSTAVIRMQSNPRQDPVFSAGCALDTGF